MQEKQRAPGGVPPAEAFDRLPKRKPPNLPGYEREREAERAAGGGSAGGAGRKSARGEAPVDGWQGAGGGSTDGAGRPQRESKPRKPVNPARRRRRLRVVAVLSIVLLIAAGCIFTVQTLFKIEQFELAEEGPYSLEELRAAFGLAAGDNMYGFAAGSAEARMEAALPYAEEVKIHRRLPGTIVFEVEPAVESYAVELPEGGYAVLSASRKVLREAPELPQSLLELRGLEGLVLEPGQPMRLLADMAESGGAAPDARSDGGAGSTSAAESGSNVQGADGVASGSAPGSDGTEDGDGAENSSGDDTTVSVAERLALLDMLLAAIADAGLTDVNWVDVSDALGLKFGWEGRITVLLGARSGLENKLATAAVLLTDSEKSLVDETSRGTLDMTYYASTGRSYFQPV